MTNHPELKAFFINERIDEQETMLEIHEHIAHGSGKARRFVCEFDSSDRKLAEITLAALNTRPSPIISEDAVTREAAGCTGTTGATAASVCTTSSTSLEPVSDDITEALISFDELCNIDRERIREMCAAVISADRQEKVEPVTDDALREAVKLVKQHDVIIVEGIGVELWEAISTLITNAIKGQSK